MGMAYKNMGLQPVYCFCRLTFRAQRTFKSTGDRLVPRNQELWCSVPQEPGTSGARYPGTSGALYPGTKNRGARYLGTRNRGARYPRNQEPVVLGTQDPGSVVLGTQETRNRVARYPSVYKENQLWLEF